MSLLHELKRRNVPRIAVAYLAGSWLVIQVAETFLPIFGAPETGARVVVVALAIGFIPLLVLSWLYQWTPEGFRLDRQAGAAGSAPQATRRLDRLIIVTLTLAVGYFAVDKFLLDPVRDARLAETVARQARAEAVEHVYGQRSIAVLAFTSSDPENVGFAEGVSEEILTTLAGVPELRVAASTSAFSFKDSGATAREIADALGVTHLLEGSVRTSGDRVRVAARLVDAITDTQVWSESFERRLEGVFEIQDEIAERVVRALELGVLRPLPQARETDPEAYRNYLQATYLLRTGRDVSDEAEELLQRALDRDPGYVPAILALARVYNRRAFNEPEKYMKLVRELVDRALEIDPDDGHAHGWLAWIAMWYGEQPDLETAARETELSLSLDPTNLDNLHGVQQTARVFGRYDDAITLGRYEIARDPICSRCHAQLATSYLVAGDLDAARQMYEQALRLDPQLEPTSRFNFGVIELLRGDAAAALSEFERIAGDHPYRALGVALASHSLGLAPEFDAAVARLQALEPTSRWMAPVSAWIGNFDQAFDALAANVDRGITSYRYLPTPQDPIYRKLHAHPRWNEVLRMRGVTPAQLAEIDFRPEIPPVITAAIG